MKGAASCLSGHRLSAHSPEQLPRGTLAVVEGGRDAESLTPLATRTQERMTGALANVSEEHAGPLPRYSRALAPR
jgi:hypothetical protein